MGHINYNRDVFNAKGDILNAKGDIFNYSNAKGDILNAGGNPLCGMTETQVEAYYKTKPYDVNYWDWLDGKCDEEAADKGVFYTINQILGIADKATDIKNKWEQGTTVEEPGVDYEVKLGEQQYQKSNAIWYIAGGVVVLLVVGLIIAKSKK